MSSGFIIANLHLLSSVVKPFFLLIERFVKTAELLISLPAAEIVKIQPTGNASLGVAFPDGISP